jgi:hypothetical protein
LSLSFFGVHHSWLTNQVVVCDNYWWWWSWVFLFVYFVFGFVCCYLCIIVGFCVFCGAQHWNLEVHSSLLCENGCDFIGFMCKSQGKQHYMEDLLTCVTHLSSTFKKIWVIWF